MAAPSDVVISQIPPDLSKATVEDMLSYFDNTWQLYETLFRGFSDDSAYYIIPDPLRRPLIFYLGHTAALYINKLKLAGVLTEGLNPEFEKLFATGVDPITTDQLDNHKFTRDQLPTTEAVWEYRRQVYEKMVDVIKNWPKYSLPITDKSKFWAVLLGFEHERIHYETSTCLIRQMPIDKLRKPKGWTYAPYSKTSAPVNDMLTVAAGEVEFGKPSDFPSYGWDNEYGTMRTFVPSFQASKFLITNAEYLPFVRSGAYDKQEYWGTEGWEWKNRVNAKHPLWWIPDASNECGFKYRAMYDEMDMPMNWPVDCNWHEAKAFANWKGKGYRLISEAEWHRMRAGKNTTFFKSAKTNTVVDDVAFADPKQNKGNFNMRFGSSSPVDFFVPSDAGFYDLYGNVWEYAENHYYGLKGFNTHPFYVDFSKPCFDWGHTLMMGGAWSSTGCSASSFGRFAFRRHFYQNCGFRLARTIDDDKEKNVYESERLVAEYLLFHFGKEKEMLPYSFGPKDALDFAKRVADETRGFWEKEVASRKQKPSSVVAMDLGAAVGRTSFELARVATTVHGIDYSQAFVDVCNDLKVKGKLPYTYIEEGKITRDAVAEVASDIDRSRVQFFRGDACSLPGGIGPYDIVVMANLIDRLHSPAQTLAHIGSIMNDNGILVITSPYTWYEQFTSSENWLGGFTKEVHTAVGSFGTQREVDSKQAEDSKTEPVQEVRTIDSLKYILHPLFEFVETKDVPFLIREHSRKYQWSVAQMSVWRRRCFNNEFF